MGQLHSKKETFSKIPKLFSWSRKILTFKMNCTWIFH